MILVKSNLLTMSHLGHDLNRHYAQVLGPSSTLLRPGRAEAQLLLGV
jgi:hypothetical protein